MLLLLRARPVVAVVQRRSAPGSGGGDDCHTLHMVDLHNATTCRFALPDAEVS